MSDSLRHNVEGRIFMSLFKISVLVLCYFISRVALAATCENFEGHKVKRKLCFDETLKAWISADCLKKSCEARKHFATKNEIALSSLGSLGQNPGSLVCHQLKLSVVILRDSQNNEQSFCLFKDQSLVDTNALERNVK